MGQVTICKEMFKRTYQISDSRINTAMKKVHGRAGIKDKRGVEQGGVNKITVQQYQDVVDFIKKVPTYESHYCRKETSAKFLSPGVTLAELIEVYMEEYKDSKVSETKFKDIFYKEFNLRSAILKKDTCNFCDKTHALMSSETNQSKKDELKSSHEEHLQLAEGAKKYMNSDIKLAQDSEDIECLTFDMEKTLPLPKIPTNVVYYKRQLWLYNEGVYSARKNQGYCYVWLEGEAGKGAQEIGSVLMRHLKEELPNNIKKLILWSDSCGGQNRNIKITLMMKAIMEQHPNLEEVVFKFLYSGHSYLPNDRHFSSIEVALKHQQRLYIPEDYIEIMKKSKKKIPLKVKKMNKEEFHSTDTIEKHIVNRKIGTNKEKVSWLRARQVSVNKNDMYSIKILDSLSGDNWVVIDIKPKNKPEIVSFEQMLTPLWPNGKPISPAKLRDLMSLLQFIPQSCHSFYINLSSESNVIDDVDGFGVDNLDFEHD